MAGDAWREVMLEDVASEITVGHVGPMTSEYVPEGIPFLRSQNVDYLRINTRDMKFITPAFHERLRKSSLSPGDVVIVRTGKPGTCTVIPDWLPVANCSDLVIVRCSRELDARFLAYFVNSVASHHVAAHLVGAVQQHFNVGSARTMRLNLPPIVEQRAIAHILGALDDKIEVNRRMIETLEAMARALFQSWFVDFDPVRAKAEGRDPGLPKDIGDLFPDHFGDFELGEIPEGWATVPLGSLCSRVSMGPFGSDIKTDNFIEVGVPVVRGRNLTDGFVDEGFVFVSEDKADQLRNANARTGDIVITHRGTLGQVGLIPEGSRYPRYVVSQSQMVLSINPNVSAPRYIFEFLRSPIGQHWLLANASQVGVPAIARPTTNVKAIPIVAPCVELLRAFERLLEPMLKRVVTNTSESMTLATLRGALLPKLISGELQIEDAERFLEERGP